MATPMRWLGCAALCCVTIARAEEVRVISARPDAVSVTIYRDFLALVTETRTVELPQGAVTLEFDGVVDTMIPQSAVVADTGREVSESDYDLERVTPRNLLRKSIGKTVMLTRTKPGTGKIRQVPATVLSADKEGVVFQTADGAEALHCSGLPEALTLEEVPAGLKREPTLSIRLSGGAPGKRLVRLSYLAKNFAWKADYVARLSPDGTRMDLHGWLTLRNFSDANLRDAQVQVVGGRLNLIDENDGGSSVRGDTAHDYNDEQVQRARDEKLEELAQASTAEKSRDLPDVLSGCYPLGHTDIPPEEVVFGPVLGVPREAAPAVGGGEELDEIVVVKGFREAERESLADYQLYRLPWNTDLAARQSKQVAFLHKDAVKIERFYSIRLASDENIDLQDLDGDTLPASIRIGWKNVASDGLGEPLPGGTVRFFDPDGAREIFAGDAQLDDSPVGTPIELRIGRCVDVNVTIGGANLDEAPLGLFTLLSHRIYLPLELRVSNAKAHPVLVEIRQGKMSPFPALRIKDASLPVKKKAGDYAWRFTVPANGDETLRYRVGGKVDPEAL